MNNDETGPLTCGRLPLTNHALQRIQSRTFSREAVAMVMAYGRLVRVRGAEIYAVGRREVVRYAQLGIDLGIAAGVQVVCARDGAIVTAYRNNDFSALRPRRGRPRRRRRA